MENIINLASKPEWWFSAVLVGVLINLVSTYLKEYLEKVFARITKSRTERSAQRKRYRELRLELLSNSEHELYLALFELNHLKLICIFDYLIAVMFAVFAVATKDSNQFLYAITGSMTIISLLTAMKSQITHGKESLFLMDVKMKAVEKHNKFNQQDVT